MRPKVIRPLSLPSVRVFMCLRVRIKFSTHLTMQQCTNSIYIKKTHLRKCSQQQEATWLFFLCLLHGVALTRHSQSSKSASTATALFLRPCLRFRASSAHTKLLSVYNLHLLRHPQSAPHDPYPPWHLDLGTCLATPQNTHPGSPSPISDHTMAQKLLSIILSDKARSRTSHFSLHLPLHRSNS